jgi:hypothetical protein
VTLEGKITWGATAEGDGGLYSWQTGEGGAILDQVGRLEVTATRCRRFMKFAVSLRAYFKCDCANHHEC